MRPTLSPDGKRLVYARRDDAKDLLVQRDLSSGAETILDRDLSRDEGEGFSQMDLLPGAAFTPDGKAIVYWSEGKIRRVDPATGKGSVIPFTADVSLDLRPLLRVEKPVGEPELRVKLLRWPTLSPDGSQVAYFVGHEVDEARQELRVVSTNGSENRLLHTGNFWHLKIAPRWSPDGTRVAVTLASRAVAEVGVLENFLPTEKLAAK